MGISVSCPLYVNNRRECNKKFHYLIYLNTLEFCASDDGYRDCIFYKDIKTPEKKCKYADQCMKLHLDFPFELFPITAERLNYIGKQYCFSKNRKNCAIYKKFEAGKKPSLLLTPEGTMLK